jgi:eukaryotic-like serine/threonine-protein kinase
VACRKTMLIRTLSFIVTVAVIEPRAARAQDMPMFRGNLAHSGVYSGPAVTTLTGVKWKFKADGRIYSSPAVSEGTVYVGANDGAMYAVDADSGKLRWKFQTEARIPGSPAVANGVVYFASYDGKFYAVDAATGRARWIFKTNGERRFAGTNLHGFVPAGDRMPDPYDIYLSSPAVWRNVVYFGSGDGNVYALDAETGRQKWRFKTGDVVHASPAIANGVVYIGSWDSFFYAIDAATGKERWRFKTGVDSVIHNQQGIQSSAAVADGAVYFGCRDGHLYAVDALTGKKRWEFSTGGGWVNASPAVRGNRVYMATADGRWLRELDAATGTSLYAQQFAAYFFASPALVENIAYVANWDGRLFAVDVEARKTLWSFQTDASKQNLASFTGPGGAVLYRGDKVDRTGFVDEAPMLVNFSLSQLGGFVSSPVVVGGVIYIGSADGYLYALR